jgi:transcription antitermination factor NusA-like protein
VTIEAGKACRGAAAIGGGISERCSFSFVAGRQTSSEVKTNSRMISIPHPRKFGAAEDVVTGTTKTSAVTVSAVSSHNSSTNNNNNKREKEQSVNLMNKWPSENAHTALRLLVETRLATRLFRAGKKTDREDAAADDDVEPGKENTCGDGEDDGGSDLVFVNELKSKYKGIQVEGLRAPMDCLMRTCLIHCSAREAKLEEKDVESFPRALKRTTTTRKKSVHEGGDEYGDGDGDHEKATTKLSSADDDENGMVLLEDTDKDKENDCDNDEDDDGFKIRSKTAKVGLEIVKRCLDMDEQSHHSSQARHFVVRMLLPTGQCGQCIGKGGANIKRLREKAPRCEVKIHDVGQVPPCATPEDRVLEMIGAREDIEIVAAELFETLSYFHFDKSVLPYFESLAVCNRSPQDISDALEQYGRRSIYSSNTSPLMMNNMSGNVGGIPYQFYHQQQQQYQPQPQMVMPTMVSAGIVMPMPATNAPPLYNPMMMPVVAAMNGFGGNGIMHAQVTADLVQGQHVAATAMGHVMSQQPVSMRYNPVAIGPSQALMGGFPIMPHAAVWENSNWSSFGGLDIPDIVQTTTPSGATIPVIPAQMLAHSREDVQQRANDGVGKNPYSQFFTSNNDRLHVHDDDGNVAVPNPDPLNIISFLPGDDLYDFEQDANGFAQPIPNVHEEQDEFTEMAKISVPKKNLGIVLGEDSANTKVVARMSNTYISVAVDPNPESEDVTICMLGKTEEDIENAKDALEALSLGAESHHHYF